LFLPFPTLSLCARDLFSLRKRPFLLKEGSASCPYGKGGGAGSADLLTPGLLKGRASAVPYGRKVGRKGERPTYKRWSASTELGVLQFYYSIGGKKVDSQRCRCSTSLHASPVLYSIPHITRYPFLAAQVLSSHMERDRTSAEAGRRSRRFQKGGGPT
jgi:hypothetical protein